MKKALLTTIIAGASLLYSCQPQTQQEQHTQFPDTLYVISKGDTTIYLQQQPQDLQKKSIWQQINDYATTRDSTRAAKQNESVQKYKGVMHPQEE
jgi:hypothetical protein